jgi:tetratricopeptide (TPR) repeat protein
MKAKNFNILIKRIKTKSVDPKYKTHIMSLADRLQDFSVLNQSIKNSYFSEEEKNCSRKNYLINIVSHFEAWMRILFKRTLNSNNSNIKEVASKIKAKIKVEDLITMQAEHVSISQVIIESINFQSLDEIQSYFSSLLGFDFFENIVLIEKTGMKPPIQTFYVKLEEGLNKRHEIIHNFINDLTLSDDFIEEFNEIVINFTMNAMGLCNYAIKQKIGYDPDVLSVYLSIYGEMGEKNQEYKKHLSLIGKKIINVNESENFDEIILDMIKEDSPKPLIDFFNERIEKFETDLVSRLYLGNIYLQMNKFEKCEEFIKESIFIEPKFPFIWHYYAEFYVYQGELDEGIKCIQRALTFYHEDTSLWLILVYILFITKHEINENFLKNAFEYFTHYDLFFIVRDLISYKNHFEELDIFIDIIHDSLPEPRKAEFRKLIELIDKRWNEYMKEGLEWRFFRFF